MTISLNYPNRGAQNADGVLAFLNYEDGWNVLCHQCSLMLSGKSKVYKLTDSLVRVGFSYSNGDPNWAINVARELNVPTSTTLSQLASNNS